MVSIMPPPPTVFYPVEPVTPTDYMGHMSHQQQSHLSYLIGLPSVPQLPPLPVSMPSTYSGLAMMPQSVETQYAPKQSHQVPFQYQQYSAWPFVYRRAPMESAQPYHGPWNQGQSKSIGSNTFMSEQEVWQPRPMPNQLGHQKVPGFGGYDYHLQQRSELDARKQMQYDSHATSEPKSGGVSSKLDYNVDRMAEFLCASASDIMGMSHPPQHSFIKFTHQILSSTRLPGSTIVLSLAYLQKRCELQMPSANEQYSMLIVSLILANKFNDDNTFTNKSWAEVTGLRMSDLTKVEMKWLQLINWHLNLGDADFPIWTKWNQRWIDYRNETEKAANARLSHPFHHHQQQPVQNLSPELQWYDHQGHHDDSSRHRSMYYDGQYQGFSNIHQQPSYRYDPFQTSAYFQPPLQPHQHREQSYRQVTHHSLMGGSSYSPNCNCHYCVFSPVLQLPVGPAPAVC
ncbi:uncharacterized protein V1518DRAFT_425997 [Limtongia smithiae]|uniref:uncharacterized protein n=1 Tax=Limtongia smithiae TaxID=1125753 RepID=UPI0034CDF1BA